MLLYFTIYSENDNIGNKEGEKMNLLPMMLNKLDAPVKDFEVAFRSYIVHTILKKYSDKEELFKEFKKKYDGLKILDVILSQKLQSQLGNYINKDGMSTKKWDKCWENLQFIDKSFEKGEHFEDHDAIYLSLAIDFSYCFVTLFNDMIQMFSDSTEYMYLSSLFLQCRNCLSHRASYTVSSELADQTVIFMQKIGDFIDPSFFWYRSWEEISNDIKKFSSGYDTYFLKYQNLDMIPFPEDKIVCREAEIKNLFKLICGWNGERFLRNRKHLTCIAGYGGVGKTALVAEFISRVLDHHIQDKQSGWNLDFILFYSAKEKKLNYNEYDGKLEIKPHKNQITSFEALQFQLFKDLEIGSFDDSWKMKGIIVIDNLETFELEDRRKTIEYIYSDIPSTVQVIITTRIPEDADEQLHIKGFQSDEGIIFVKSFIQENNLSVRLSEEQIKDLIQYSYGNSLVLVLALKRLHWNLSTFRSILDEMKRLPKTQQDNMVSSFMYQNTIEEIYKNFPEMVHSIKTILMCLCVAGDPLDAEILTIINSNMGFEEVQSVLDVLCRYLVVEKIADSYQINDFAQQFVLIDTLSDKEYKMSVYNKVKKVQQDIKSARDALNLEKQENPELKRVLEEWNGETERECRAITLAFNLYDLKRNITKSNAAANIDLIRIEFEKIERNSIAHPYIYYEHARILKELRQDNVIGDEYNDQIKHNMNTCLMNIDGRSYRRIKETRTYPSIQWIYAQFLLSAEEYTQAAGYAEKAIKYYEKLEIYDNDYWDCVAVLGITLMRCYEKEKQLFHLRKAQEIGRSLHKHQIHTSRSLQLKDELRKYRMKV